VKGKVVIGLPSPLSVN